MKMDSAIVIMRVKAASRIPMSKGSSIQEQLNKSNTRQLLLGGQMLGAACVKALLASPGFSRVSLLHLGGNYIGDEGAALLVSSPYLCEIEELSLIQNNLSSKAARAIASSPNLHRLTKLNLCNNYLGDEGLVALLRPYAPPSAWERLLQWLALQVRATPPKKALPEAGPQGPYRRAAQLNDAAPVKPAPSVSALGTIGWLDLGWNKITDAGAKRLAGSAFLRQLSYLNLQNNGLRREGVEALMRSPFLPASLIVNVSGNPLSALEKRQLQQSAGSRLRI